ncbi:integumentary mucin C.1-like [Anastrepha ludens]|uniref:integumentary mucin C.1-like n=1 Tax=Anastrepha ludens TaxID=28586 RepID=UPI0023AE7152|nr:integumentary mucin C.1-like [Anastrepha ludens]
MQCVNAPTIQVTPKLFASASSTTTTNSKSNSNSSTTTTTTATDTDTTATPITTAPSDNVVETVFADETAPFSTAPPHATYFSKLPVSPSFDEMFATSPFRSRIYDEFERFWRSFDHTT